MISKSQPPLASRSLAYPSFPTLALLQATVLCSSSVLPSTSLLPCDFGLSWLQGLLFPDNPGKLVVIHEGIQIPVQVACPQVCNTSKNIFTYINVYSIYYPEFKSLEHKYFYSPKLIAYNCIW